MKKVAVVILNWNGKELMKQFLPSVIAHSPADIADVIVADNGSTDGSTAFLAEYFPMVRALAFDRNYGFAEGYNLAVATIDTEYTVLLNSDVEVTHNWLVRPLELLDRDPELAAVQPKIRAYRDKMSFEYAGACGGYMDKYGYPFCRGRILNTVEKDYGQYDETAPVFWVSGACMIIRTAIYQEAGGLDPLFFAHQEEIDLCWRLRNRGYHLLCEPSSVVYHVGGATLKIEHPRKTFLNYRNNLLMLYKNLPDTQMASVMRVRFWLDYLAGIHYLLKGNWKNAKAVYQARKAFYALRQNYAGSRRWNPDKTVAGQSEEIYPGSIVIAYYLKGKKRFCDLFKS